MKYRIVITATEDNPQYAKEMEEYEKRSHYSSLHIPAPVSEREVKKLETVLTEAEFNAARAAILGEM